MGIAISIRSSTEVWMVTGDGTFIVYSLDPEKGGTCKLLRKYRYTIRLFFIYIMRSL